MPRASTLLYIHWPLLSVCILGIRAGWRRPYQQAWQILWSLSRRLDSRCPADLGETAPSLARKYSTASLVSMMECRIRTALAPALHPHPPLNRNA
ncbi:hypothetical protein BJV78DRAFT_1204857, partial [Lactifluus subvellereus]